MIRKLCPSLIFLIGNLFTFQHSSAQSDFALGVKGGISIPNLKGSDNNPVSKGWSTRLGPYAGIIAELPLNNKLCLQVELNYSSQGGKKNGTLAIPTGQFDTTVPISYIYTK